MKRFVAFVLLLLICFSFLTSCRRDSVQTDAEPEGKVTDFYVTFPDSEDTDSENKGKDERAEVSFAAVGDNIIYQCGFTDAKNRANEEYPEYNFTPIYENILPQIQAADLAYINQETLMSGAEYGYTDYPCFNSPQHLGDQLVEMGFDIINIANNHMLDTTTPGLLDTVEYWRTKDVTLLGGYENEDIYNEPIIVEKNGISMVFLSYTYATNGFAPWDGYDVVVPYLEEQQLVEDIRRVRDKADTLIVSVHWGNENQFQPTEEQRHLAQVMCDEGVDVIIGTHPHVIQPVEWITRDDGSRTLCIYSLGDLVAVMTRASNMLGGLCSFDIVKVNGEISITNVLFSPVIHHFGPSYYNGKMYYLSDFTDELASTFGKVYGISADYDYFAELTRDIISEEFLPDYLKEEK